MSLDVTPGSATADSYLSLVDFKARADAVGLSYAGKSDAEVEQALRRSTRYLDGRYRPRFLGFRTNGFVQALEWPRTGVVLVWDGADTTALSGAGYRSYYGWGGYVPGTAVAVDAIPAMLKDALVEAAARELASPNSLTPDQTPARRKIQQTVGPITTIWANDPATRPVVTIIDELLAPLLVRASAYSGSLVRA